MATNYITVKGYIRNGELIVDLPENVSDGEVEVTIPVSDGDHLSLSQEEEQPLSDEEIDKLMQPEPKTGAEIIAAGHTGGWEHKGITDSVEWIKERRRKRREKRGW